MLGEQHAIALAEHGCDVVLVDLHEEACCARAGVIGELTGRQAVGLTCDVTSKPSWDALIEQVLARFGHIDVLVNNAGYTNQSPSAGFHLPAEQFPLTDWNQILNVNLTGTFLGCQAVGAHMLGRGSGSIINLASLYGVVSPNHRLYPDTGLHQPVAYSVSKAGVIGLTRYLATLWAARGVRVNCLTPGGVWNDHPSLFNERFSQQSPIGRMQRKDELRGAVVYLASGASNYCTGHNLVVDGGWTVW